MSFDGILLNKILQELDFLRTGRINKIYEADDSSFIFTIRVNRTNYQLLLCFQSDFSRINLTNRTYDNPNPPKAFTMFLRKHIDGYIINDIRCFQADRVIYFELKGFNEMQDMVTKYLICEIMGRYSNLILTTEDLVILESLKHDGIGEYNRTIMPGAKYEFPEETKLNPYSLSLDELRCQFPKLENPKEIASKYQGVSMHLAYSVFNSIDRPQSFYNALYMKPNPCIFINEKGKKDFYFISYPYEPIKEFDSISLLLEEFYYEENKQAKIKLKTNNILSFVEKQIKKNEGKVKKQESLIISAKDNDHLRIYGELLLSNAHNDYHGEYIILNNYYTNEDVKIPLDAKLNIKQNALKYFKKYQKAKSSISYIEEQIKNAKDEIEYFKIIKSQIETSDLSDILEIQEELYNQKYIKLNVNQKKKKKIKIQTFLTSDGTQILVGKNNIQNEYITHKLAKSNELWFHVKDAPGSHVLLRKTSDFTENDIRTSAMLAAYFSSMKQSSSVPVNYTLARYIKKIPGKRNCFVSISNEKTIYIDPDENIIKELKEVK